jgi:hypothetical protein
VSARVEENEMSSAMKERNRDTKDKEKKTLRGS